MKYVGFHKVRINPDGTVSKEYPQIYFDFNAVAKGYGIDCLGRYLESKGVTDYLIELGGEILIVSLAQECLEAFAKAHLGLLPWVVGGCVS